jgi:quercetin dioxygenase-like cupin family protein
MTMLLHTNPYLFHDDKTRVQSFGALVSVLASGCQTGGAFNVLDVICPVGFSTPLHIHYTEDVAVYVLEGALTFFCGDEKSEARAGSYFFQPRSTPHGFRVEGESSARILYMTVPAGFDEFVIEHAAEKRFDCTHDAARYKIEILGALPE